MVNGDVSFEEARWALYEAALSGTRGSPAAAMETHKVQLAAAVATQARLLQGAGVQVRRISTLLTPLNFRGVSYLGAAHLAYREEITATTGMFSDRTRASV